MADVIPFAPRRRFAGQPPLAEGPLGQILFLTGVRYERQPETAAVKPPRRPRPGESRETASSTLVFPAPFSPVRITKPGPGASNASA